MGPRVGAARWALLLLAICACAHVTRADLMRTSGDGDDGVAAWEPAKHSRTQPTITKGRKLLLKHRNPPPDLLNHTYIAQIKRAAATVQAKPPLPPPSPLRSPPSPPPAPLYGDGGTLLSLVKGKMGQSSPPPPLLHTHPDVLYQALSRVVHIRIPPPPPSPPHLGETSLMLSFKRAKPPPPPPYQTPDTRIFKALMATVSPPPALPPPTSEDPLLSDELVKEGHGAEKMAQELLNQTYIEQIKLVAATVQAKPPPPPLLPSYYLLPPPPLPSNYQVVNNLTLAQAVSEGDGAKGDTGGSKKEKEEQEEGEDLTLKGTAANVSNWSTTLLLLAGCVIPLVAVYFIYKNFGAPTAREAWVLTPTPKIGIPPALQIPPAPMPAPTGRYSGLLPTTGGGPPQGNAVPGGYMPTGNRGVIDNFMQHAQRRTNTASQLSGLNRNRFDM